jgi:hypothetical protein
VLCVVHSPRGCNFLLSIQVHGPKTSSIQVRGSSYYMTLFSTSTSWSCFTVLERNHYRTQLLCRVSHTLSKGYFTLGKGFAECNTRQITLGKLYIGSGLFAEYFLSVTRQRKVTVTAPSDGDRSFAECLLWHSAKRPILPSACYHGPRQRRVQWAPPPVPVPRALVGTRQRRTLCRVSSGPALGKESSSGPLCQSLCRVPWQQHSAKMALPVPRFPSLSSAMVSTRQRWLYRFPGFLLCRVPWS